MWYRNKNNIREKKNIPKAKYNCNADTIKNLTRMTDDTHDSLQSV